jgi:hypothetical protein
MFSRHKRQGQVPPTLSYTHSQDTGFWLVVHHVEYLVFHDNHLWGQLFKLNKAGSWQAIYHRMAEKYSKYNEDNRRKELDTVQ